MRMVLIKTKDAAILIDSGIDGAVRDAIVPALDAHGMELKDLTWVINTHSHDDHVCGNDEIRSAAPSVKFAIHKDGAEDLRRRNFTVDRVLSDGEVLSFGDVRLEIIEAPGHSKDSICILEKGSKTLFTGDSLQGRGLKVLGPALVFDQEAYLCSVDRLLSRYRAGDISRIILGHEMQPTNGDIIGDEIPRFLDICKETVYAYREMAKNLADVSEEEFFHSILKYGNATPTNEWISLARYAARAAAKPPQS